MVIKEYSTEYDEGIRALFKISVSGDIALALEREPIYFEGAKIQCRVPEVYVALDPISSNVIGVFNLGKRQLWFRGKKIEVRYLCDLRIHPSNQNGLTFYRILKFYKQLTCKDGYPSQTIVFADNQAMTNLIDKQMVNKSPSIPFYHLQGVIETHMIETSNQIASDENYKIRKAESNDLVALQKFINRESAKIDFFPFLDLTKLGYDYCQDLNINDFYFAEQENEIVGVIGAWDLRKIKQTRVTGYSQKFKIIRLFYNLYARLSNRKLLPVVGTCVSYKTLCSILIKNRSVSIFQSILSKIINDNKSNDVDYLLCSLHNNDPLNASLNTIKKSRKAFGNYYLVDFSQTLNDKYKSDFFYIEAARI